MAVEVFPGNFSDAAAFSAALATVRERFGLTEVVLVCDRSMITKSRIAGADLLTPAADILPTRRHTTAQHSGARPTTELAQKP